MKFLVDENVHNAIYHLLKEEGYDVTSVAYDYSSLNDNDILDLAYRQDRVLITNDKDFGYLVYHKGLKHKGIILFRLKSEQPEIKINTLKELFQKDLDFTGSFIVITEDKIRIRVRNSN